MTFNPVSLELNLDKARAQQAKRRLDLRGIEMRDEDDPSQENLAAIEIFKQTFAWISHGVGARFSFEDTAGVFLVDAFKKIDPSEFPSRLYDAIMRLQTHIEEDVPFRFHSTPGSTFNASLQFQGTIITANVGDSRAVLLSRKSPTNAFTATALSWDHKPIDSDELARIQADGGFVSDARLNGSLAVSRALGDIIFDNNGISHEPDLTTITVDADAENILLNCCDGVFDVMLERDIANFFDRIDLQDNPANQLRREVYLRGSMDNISVVVTPVVPTLTTPVLSFVADGHGGDQVSRYICEHLQETL
jgi:serine/threonine protein phosphatase PrpC